MNFSASCDGTLGHDLKRQEKGKATGTEGRLGLPGSGVGWAHGNV